MSDDKELFEEKFKGVYAQLESIECNSIRRIELMEKNSADKLSFFEKFLGEKLDRIESNTARTNGHVADLFEKDRLIMEAMIKADKELEAKIAKVEERVKSGWGYFIRENPKLVAFAIVLVLALLGVNLFELSLA